MKGSQKGFRFKTKILKCWPARVSGVMGIFISLWLWFYGLEAIPENPKVLPLVILIGLMIVGGLMDCILIGREGTGGLIVVISGSVLYLYLIFDSLVSNRSYVEGEGQIAALSGTLVLFLSGFLFYLCGRRRRKLGD